MDWPKVKQVVKEQAALAGFARAGVAGVDLRGRGGGLEEFLHRGYQADMAWLARQGPARLDASSVMPQAASVICLSMPYAPQGVPEGHVAMYARGRNYHRLLEGHCRKLIEAMKAAQPALAETLLAKICVDTAAISDRSFAAAAGLGWIGRNGCLIDPRYGSYAVLAEIVTNLPLPPDEPVAQGCGDCHACVDACPGGALPGNGLVDCRRCASYLTIEHRASIAEDRYKSIGGNIFGCDACQRVCPCNASVPPGEAEMTHPRPLAEMPLAEVLALSEPRWDELTRGCAMRRCRYEMLLRNAAIAAGNLRRPDCRADLARLAGADLPLAAPAAAWALRQLV